MSDLFNSGEFVKSSFFRIIALFLLFFHSQSLNAAPQKITQFTIEDLMQTEVTSVAGISQPLAQSAAAVTVISQEDIRRSGANSVPEILRMVPGLDVAKINAHQWAISSRGFNDPTANKLLVLIDGRSVYTPLYGGVYWDVQDTMLENIDRIEIIRGPGATIWGSNAVNGVINIITKDTHDTQGQGIVTGTLGSEDQGGAMSYSGKIGDKTTYRGYGKYFNRNSSFNGNDAWAIGRGGLRIDSRLDEKNTVTVDGGYYSGEEDLRSSLISPTAPFSQTINEDGMIAGGHILARWKHVYSDTSDSALQIYYDQTNRDSTPFSEVRYAGDIDWKHHFAVGDRNDVVWGLGYRLNIDNTRGSYGTAFSPSRRSDGISQAFLQDTILLVQDRLWFTLGSKFEVNDYSGFEVQPTARILWQPHEKHSLWAAVSRAVRTPSRFEHDLNLHGYFVPGVLGAQLDGEDSVDSEKLYAYELGYRFQPHQRISVDSTVFYNHYTELYTFRLRDTVIQNGIPFRRYSFDDHMEADSIGSEIAVKTQVTDWMRVDSGYSFLQLYVGGSENALGTAETIEGRSPEHQIFVRPSLDLPYKLELDGGLRYVSGLKQSHVPAYWEMDLRLGWRPVDSLEFSVVGQNLFHNHHREFGNPGGPEPERAVYGNTVVKF